MAIVPIGPDAASAAGTSLAALDRLADEAAAEMAASRDTPGTPPVSALIAARFAPAGLATPRVLRDPDPNALENAALAGLYGYWRGLANKAGTVPHVDSIDPLDLRPWLGNLMLLEAVGGDRDFRYRVYGTAIAARARFDLTGKYTSDLMALTGQDGLIPLFFTAVYRRVVAERCPWFTEHEAPATVTATAWQRLILPLAARSGRIQRLLVGNLPRA